MTSQSKTRVVAEEKIPAGEEKNGSTQVCPDCGEWRRNPSYPFCFHCNTENFPQRQAKALMSEEGTVLARDEDALRLALERKQEFEGLLSAINASWRQAKNEVEVKKQEKGIAYIDGATYKLVFDQMLEQILDQNPRIRELLSRKRAETFNERVDMVSKDLYARTKSLNALIKSLEEKTAQQKQEKKASIRVA